MESALRTGSRCPPRVTERHMCVAGRCALPKCLDLRAMESPFGGRGRNVLRCVLGSASSRGCAGVGVQRVAHRLADGRWSGASSHETAAEEKFVCLQPVVIQLQRTHCSPALCRAIHRSSMSQSSANATSMHQAPIGQPGSTSSEPAAAADSLGSLSGAHPDAQLTSLGARARTSPTGRASDGASPTSPLSQPPRRHAPVPLQLSAPGGRTDAQMHCDSVERRLTHDGSC